MAGVLKWWNPATSAWEAVTGAPGALAPDEVVIQPDDPGLPAVGVYPRLWVDTDDSPGGAPDYLPTAGGIMTGPLHLNGDPVLPQEAASKAYVDDLVGSGAGYLPLTGGTLTGPLTVPWLVQEAIMPIPNGSDLNDAPGGVGFGESFVNAPHGDLAGWYVETWVASSTYRVQRATQGYVDNPATFQRTMVAGLWKPWKHLGGGLPDSVAFQTASVNAITATAWALIGETAFNAPFPLSGLVTLRGWLSVAPGTNADLRVSASFTGATSQAAPVPNWHSTLYQGNNVASGVTQYGSHGTAFPYDFAKGVTNVGIQAYKTGAAGASFNYGRIDMVPIKFLDG